MNTLLLQFNSVWQDSQANLEKLDQLFAEYVLHQDIDLVILPETFHAGFSMQPALFAESIDGVISQHLSQLAQEYQVNLVAGVAQKQVRGNCHGQSVRFYNRALAFNRQGEKIGAYSKQKLFSYAGEQEMFQSGYSPEVVDIDGQPVALFVCYDLRFPELFRQVAQDVKAMIVIANWPDSRQLHWESLLKARAIENQCFVIGVNRTGNDENGLRYAGGSSITSPLGETLVYGHDEQLAVKAKVDLDQVDQVRQKFPFLEDR